MGRELPLAELHASFAHAQFKALACLGPAGVGKTQLAVEYAHDACSRYDVVIWVSAPTLFSLRAQLVAPALRQALAPLGLAAADGDTEAAQLAALAAWLRTHERWLLVCDNAGIVAAEVLIELLQDAPSGHVLFTSRQVDWEVAMGDLTLGRLPEVVALEYLRARTRGYDPGGPAEAAALARELDGSPLALRLAGDYLEALQAPYAAYLAQLEAADRRGPSAEDSECRSILPAGWRAAQVAVGPSGRAMLELLSFLAPAPFPRAPLEQSGVAGEVLALEAAGGRTASDVEGAAPVLERLARFGMIELTPDSVVPRGSLRGETCAIRKGERRLGFERALRAFELARAPSAAASSSEHGPDAKLEGMQAHAFALLEAAEALDTQPLAAGLYADLGALLLAKGRFHEAEPLLRSALQLHEAVLGPDDPELPRHLHRLAEVLVALSRNEEAEPFAHRALRQELAEVLA